MKIAVISDIHGNATALSKVLTDLRRRSIDQIVCLGDVATLGPQPHQVIDQLRRLRCSIIMGNHDAWLLTSAPPRKSPTLPHLTDIIAWTRDQLSPADLEFMSAFQHSVNVPLGGGANLLCFHGSPRSYEDIILATTPESDLQSMLEGYQATIMAGGHTHIQMIRRHRDFIVLNPGSVGVPFRYVEYARLPPADKPSYSPWAEYAIVTCLNGQVAIELCRLPFDVMKVKRLANSSGMPHASWWVSLWD